MLSSNTDTTQPPPAFGSGGRLRRFPQLLKSALSLTWSAAPRELLQSTVTEVVTGVGVLAQLLIIRVLLDRVLNRPDLSIGDAIIPLVALAAVTAVLRLADLARAELQRVSGELVTKHTVGMVLRVSAGAGLIDYEDPAFHDRLQRAIGDAASRPLGMTSGLLMTLNGSVAVIGVAVALMIVEPLLLLGIGVAFIPVWFASKRASEILYRFARSQTERDRRRNYLMLVLHRREWAAEMRAFSLGAPLLRRWEQLTDQRVDDLRASARKRLRFGLVGAAATSVLVGLTMVLLLWFVTSDRIDLADAGTAVAALLLLNQRLQALSAGANSLYESSLFLEDFTSFVGDTAPVASPGGPLEPIAFEHIELSGATFSYPSRDEPAIRGIDLEIGRGEVVALVGENGSGKTTLAKLIAGLYPLDSGSYLIDGVDVNDIGDRRVRDSIAVIFQEFGRYYMTAAENIALGRVDDEARPDEIESAARQASADELISDLANGYETMLGTEFSGATELSGGQWQRIALARAFFRDAPLLILDEPTAALDARSEAELFASIRELYSDRTALLISHRFSSVRSADRIYVLEQGRIVEHGTHDELIAADGLYAELFGLQADAYLPDT